MQAEESHVRGDVTPSRRVQKLGKPRSYGVTLRRKTRQRHARAAYLGNERARPVEDVNPRMLREANVWKSAAFVVAGDDEDRYASVRDTRQRLEGLIGQARHRPRSVEDVTAVHDEIDLAGKRRRERRGVVGQEVIPAPAPFDPLPDGEVEAQVRIGQEENANDVGHRTQRASIRIAATRTSFTAPAFPPGPE